MTDNYLQFYIYVKFIRNMSLLYVHEGYNDRVECGILLITTDLRADDERGR